MFFVIIKLTQYFSSFHPVYYLYRSSYFKSVFILIHDVSNNTSPPQISKLFNYQHKIHSHSTRSSTRGNFFLEYSRLDKQNMSFSRNGVRIWNNLSNEIRQMPKAIFKRNIHNMLLQKLSEAN